MLLCSHHVIAYSQDQVAHPLKEKRSLGVFACDWCMLGKSLASLLQTLSGQAVLRRSEADEVEVYLSIYPLWVFGVEQVFVRAIL